MVKKILYLATLAVGLAACEKMPTIPDYRPDYTPVIMADTLDATDGAVEQARPHRKNDR